jgi:hypothetical protein
MVEGRSWLFNAAFDYAALESLERSITRDATPACSVLFSANIAKWDRRWCQEKEMRLSSRGIRNVVFVAGIQFPDDPRQILLSWSQ